MGVPAAAHLSGIPSSPLSPWGPLMGSSAGCFLPLHLSRENQGGFSYNMGCVSMHIHGAVLGPPMPFPSSGTGCRVSDGAVGSLLDHTLHLQNGPAGWLLMDPSGVRRVLGVPGDVGDTQGRKIPSPCVGQRLKQRGRGGRAPLKPCGTGALLLVMLMWCQGSPGCFEHPLVSLVSC